MDALCKRLSPTYDIAAITNDIYTKEDAEFLTRSDLLVINKIDLAPHVGASLEVMDRDSKRMRGDRPYLFANIRAGQGVEEIASFIQCAGGLSA